jgi:hypothetical protein
MATLQETAGERLYKKTVKAARRNNTLKDSDRPAM